MKKLHNFLWFCLVGFIVLALVGIIKHSLFLISMGFIGAVIFQGCIMLWRVK